MSGDATTVGSVRELVDLLIARRIPAGATVELAIENPEITTLTQIDTLHEALKRVGARLIRRRGLAPQRVTIYPPGTNLQLLRR